MFDAIAHRYDLLNRILSLGLDTRWRSRTVRELGLAPGSCVLDLATGTADLARSILETVPQSTVVGLDLSAQMVRIGAEKTKKWGLARRLALQMGDAQNLCYVDAAFDAVTMAFGIRNVPDRSKALAEMARVTKQKGRIAILELSEPQGGVFSSLARAYVHGLVPRIGAILSGAKEYRYLQSSIAAFPKAEDFADVMERSGIHVLGIHPLSFGACHLFLGEPN